MSPKWQWLSEYMEMNSTFNVKMFALGIWIILAHDLGLNGTFIVFSDIFTVFFVKNRQISTINVQHIDNKSSLNIIPTRIFDEL